MSPSASSDGSCASCSTASSGSPTNMPSTWAARAIDSAGAVEACGPKQNSGAPYRCFSLCISATSGCSVGVVVGNTTSVGEKPSASSFAITCSVVSRAAVASMSLTSQPALRSSVASRARVYGGLVVPSTSSRSWQRPCRVNAMPLMSGGLISSVREPSIGVTAPPSAESRAAAGPPHLRRRVRRPAAAKARPCSTGGRPGRCRSRPGSFA